MLIAAFDQLARMNLRFFGASAVAARALASYLVGDYAGAAHFYRDDLKRAAARMPAEQAGSWIALSAGDLDRAETQARSESRVAPNDPEPVLTLAEIALARRDGSSALSHARRVLELRRDDVDALLVTTVAHARQGAHAAAIDAIKRALGHDRVERRATVFLSVLEVTGELDDRAIDERPSALLAHLHRYLRTYDPSQARPTLRYAQRAIDLGERADDAYVTLGFIHRSEGHPSRALAAFQQALRVNPRNTAALLGAAGYRAARGELAKEYQLTRAAFEADPDDPFVTAAFYRLLVDKLGDNRQAQAMAEAAVARNPRDAEAWSRLGRVQAQLGDPRRGLQSYQQAAALAPRTAELEDGMAGALVGLGRDDEALAAYRRAVALDPLRPQPHYGLGVLHGRARRLNEAIQEYEMGHALGGRDAAHAAALCDLYRDAGRSQEAAACAAGITARHAERVSMLGLRDYVRGPQRSASAER
jgi:tetratricopeptide (TPR) repeat protein